MTAAGLVSVFAGGNGSFSASNTAAGAGDGVGTAAGMRAPRGIAVTPLGVVFIADTANHKIRSATPDGRVGTLAGGLWGALLLLTLEDLTAEITPHWQFYVGWVLLAVVLMAPKGLSGLPEMWRRRRKSPPADGAKP